MGPLPPRLARLPVADGFADVHVRRADSFAARLLGLALLDRPPASVGLLLPGTRAIHTFGMRFALDLVWLDGEGRVLRVDRGVRPRRLAACRQAAAVLELPAREGPARPAGSACRSPARRRSTS